MELENHKKTHNLKVLIATIVIVDVFVVETS